MSTIRITPSGALAAAFGKVAEEAREPGAWWRTSPLLSGIGMAHHLNESGWTITRKDQPVDPTVLAEALGSTGLCGHSSCPRDTSRHIDEAYEIVAAYVRLVG